MQAYVNSLVTLFSYWQLSQNCAHAKYRLIGPVSATGHHQKGQTYCVESHNKTLTTHEAEVL